jgi:hypothetical protein
MSSPGSDRRETRLSSDCGYRRKSESAPADDKNAVVSGHRADPACGNLRAPKLAPSLARFAEPPIVIIARRASAWARSGWPPDPVPGVQLTSRRGHLGSYPRHLSVPTRPDARRAAAKVLANGRGDLNQPFPETQWRPLSCYRDTRMREDSRCVGSLAMSC